jgi:hypothetical protein
VNKKKGKETGDISTGGGVRHTSPRSIDIPPKGYRSMAGANAHQNVSDQVYEALLNKTKAELLVQRSDYYINKLKGKKYLVIENDERPEKPRARFQRTLPEDRTQAQAEDKIIYSR